MFRNTGESFYVIKQVVVNIPQLHADLGGKFVTNVVSMGQKTVDALRSRAVQLESLNLHGSGELLSSCEVRFDTDLAEQIISSFGMS